MEHGEELALFFGGLDPRLETAQTRERELDVKLARRFNAFDYLDKRELSLSRIIANLLKPRARRSVQRIVVKCERPTMASGASRHARGSRSPGRRRRAAAWKNAA